MGAMGAMAVRSSCAVMPMRIHFYPSIMSLTGKRNMRGGMGSNCHGRNSDDCIVKVAPGTVVSDGDGEWVGELIQEGDELVIAKGGKGGIGNARFKSSTNRALGSSRKGLWAMK